MEGAEFAIFYLMFARSLRFETLAAWDDENFDFGRLTLAFVLFFIRRNSGYNGIWHAKAQPWENSEI